LMLSQPSASALERFRRAALTCSLLIGVSRSQEMMTAMKEILEGEKSEASARVVQRLFRAIRQRRRRTGFRTAS